MKLISWNLNGIRAASKKGLAEFVWREAPDILCFQETKAQREQVEPWLLDFKTDGLQYRSFWSSAVRKGYSGVATYIKEPVSEGLLLETNIGIDAYEQEGRIVLTKHSDFWLYNIYFPNGGSGEERHQFKQKFLQDLLAHLAPLVRSGQPIIVTGDYNVAHREQDVYDPVRLQNESGFLFEERKWMDDFLATGFVDAFRHIHPNERDRFTWWSYVERGRIANRGWRIDYFCVTKNLASRIVSAEILDQVEGSDHCPVLLELQ